MIYHIILFKILMKLRNFPNIVELLKFHTDVAIADVAKSSQPMSGYVLYCFGLICNYNWSSHLIKHASHQNTHFIKLM